MQHISPGPKFVLAAGMASAFVLLAASPAGAQDEAALRRAFEGRRVTVKIDMPGTSDGIDVYADREPAVDYRRHGDRLKDNGTAIRAGDAATVTLVKVKDDLIEFQLNGGGFGTFGDDYGTSVNIPLIDKSQREKDLEARIRKESDAREKRRMERELDELERDRARENRRIEAERAEAEERRKARVMEQRLRGGSRFNVRYNRDIPGNYAPEDLVAALREYVDFQSAPGSIDSPPLIDDAPFKGMLREDAERDFGRPVDVSERREGSLTVVTLVFARPGQRITAEFVEDVLIRYSVASR